MSARRLASRNGPPDPGGPSLRGCPGVLPGILGGPVNGPAPGAGCDVVDFLLCGRGVLAHLSR
eukprot:15484647-Alexandrium_andersonii.AAC.1